MHRGIVVQTGDESKQIGLRCRLVEAMYLTENSGFRTGLLFVSNLDLACRILTDQYGGEFRSHTRRLCERSDRISQTFSNRGGDEFAINDAGRHNKSRPFFAGPTTVDPLSISIRTVYNGPRRWTEATANRFREVR